MSLFLVPQRQTLARRECSLEESLPPSHLARFVWRALESLDFTELESAYASVRGGPGRPPYHPRVLAALWIYGMTQGMETAAEIAEACTIRDDFRWLAGGLTPCDQTFLNFVGTARERILAIWERLLQAMHEAGHIDLSVLAEDGTKLRANASKRSFQRGEEIAQVIQDLKSLLAKKLSEVVSAEEVRKHQAQVLGLKSRLNRAQQAYQKVESRLVPPSETQGGSDPVSSRHQTSTDPTGVPASQPVSPDGESPALQPKPSDEAHSKGPQASLTEPEAALMRATSEKRFAPSYNADLTATRHGVIVSQFLTTANSDFDHFPRALPFVLGVLGRPQAWAGDGQYHTLTNLRLAHQAGVPLYVPGEGLGGVPNGVFPLSSFRYDPQKDVLVCPAGQELVKLGTQGQQQGRPVDLYGRRDCTGCALKSQCTQSRGRKVRRPHGQELIAALEVRMNEVGEQVLRFRDQTIEPVNAHLKQHGLGRFHVRGLTRCAVLLTLAAMAHNLMKWKAREAARALRRTA